MPRKALRVAVVAALWLGIWWLAAAVVDQALLLPSPVQTLRALWALAATLLFWRSTLGSMVRIVLGFIMGTAVGMGLAVCTSRFAWARAFFAPLLAAVKATPVASFILLALVWIRTDGVPVFATSLIVLPVAWANLTEGIAATDPLLLEMTRAFRISPMKRLRVLYWPTVKPYCRAAITTGIGMAWKAGVAAEVIATPRLSLGSRLYDAKVYLDTPSLFATTAVIILLSLLLEKATVWLMRERKTDG